MIAVSLAAVNAANNEYAVAHVGKLLYQREGKLHSISTGSITAARCMICVRCLMFICCAFSFAAKKYDNTRLNCEDAKADLKNANEWIWRSNSSREDKIETSTAEGMWRNKK